MIVRRLADTPCPQDGAELLLGGWHIPFARLGHSIFQMIQPPRGLRIIAPGTDRAVDVVQQMLRQLQWTGLIQ